MPVIAMSREMGSLGKDVAYGLGDVFNIRVKHHEIVDHVADKTRLRKTHVISYLQGKLGFLDRMTIDQASIAIHSADEILSLAAETSEGIVLRGWGATALLRSIPHVVCVRVCAPTELRVERMMERLDSDERDRVITEIAHSDQAHDAIMKRNFAVAATDATHYDVVLNTERMSVAECVDAVVHAVRSADFAETESSRARLANAALEARCRAALRRDGKTRNCQVGIAALGGRVMLSGVVSTIAQAEACEALSSDVRGVSGVENALKCMESAGTRRGGSI